MISWNQMRDALREARQTMRQVDTISNDCADIITERLETVSHYRLKKLKRKLSRYNAQTGEWKEGK